MTTHALTSWTHADAVARGTKRWSQFDSDILDMTVAEMDFAVAEPIHAAVQDAVERQTYGYPIPPERSELPAIAADWARRELGLPVDDGQVRLVNNLMQGIASALILGGGAGAPVICLTPTYRSFFGAIVSAGSEVIEVPLGRHGLRYLLDLDAIDAALAAGARTVLLCNPANPVGRVFGVDELRGLAELVERHGARVISDEVHAPLRYGVPFRSYASVDERARRHSTTVFSATKAWNFPGLRTGFVALTRPGDAARWNALPGAPGGGISPLGMVASKAAFLHGAAWLEQTVALLTENRAAIDGAFQRAGLAAVFLPPEGTYLAWLDVRTLGEDPARTLRERAGVATIPGPDHGAGGEGFVRMNFASQPEIVREAVSRILEVLQPSS